MYYFLAIFLVVGVLLGEEQEPKDSSLLKELQIEEEEECHEIVFDDESIVIKEEDLKILSNE